MPETARAITTGAKAANEEWFTTDATPGTPQSINAPVFVLTFAMDTTSPVEISLDSGANFVALRDETGSPTFNANTTYSRPFPVRTGDQVNVRATNGVTLLFARLDEWS